MLVRGISPAGAFNVNNNATVVATAVKECLANGVPVEDTILADDDITHYQLIAKAGGKYSNAYHEINGELVEVQKVNRVYATSDKTYGKLFKKHKQTGAVAKIASLPEHCLVDNDNQLNISVIDKQWYIDIAKRYVDEFYYKKGAKTMAEKKTLSVYHKLNAVRNAFMAGGATKSGKNNHAEYTYFELEDIVPRAEKLLTENGLFWHMTFEGGNAVGTLYDCDDSNSCIVFSVPFVQIAEPGKFRMNEIQAMGSAVTYYRRYLYFMLLDLVEADAIDCDTAPAPKQEKKAEPAPVKVSTPKKAVTTAERAEIKQELTNPDAPADEMQITALKSALMSVMKTLPAEESWVQQIAVETNGFKQISKTRAEEIIRDATAKLKK